MKIEFDEKSCIFNVSDLDIPLENGQLRQDKSTVLDYANSLLNQKNGGNQNDSEVNNQSCNPKDVFPPVSFPATERPPARIVKAIENLWLSSGVQQAYQRRNEFQLADSAAYFLCNVAKYTSDNYVPSDQDILRTRVRTTGIVKVRKKNMSQKSQCFLEIFFFGFLWDFSKGIFFGIFSWDFSWIFPREFFFNISIGFIWDFPKGIYFLKFFKGFFYFSKGILLEFSMRFLWFFF